jgi:hypothetical protein
MSKKDVYGFTVDVEHFVRICLNDPATREMVFNGIRKGALDHTTPLGAANMKDDPSHPDAWYTAFLGTSNQVAAGNEGFILRNNNGQGPRVSIRLKRQQQKSHAAQTASVTPGQLLPEQSSAQILQQALQGDVEAAKALLAIASGQEAPEEAAAPPQDTYLTL